MLISIWIAKLINWIINTFKLGTGQTWSGHIGLKVCPNFFELIQPKLPKHLIVVSGTNGKTTTSKLITHILEKQGLKVLHNYTGANLLNGVASSLMVQSTWTGALPYDAAVLEVDEMTLPNLLKHISPNVLVLLNLSRDQLDRHWEIDVVLDKWINSVSSLPVETKLILDKDQKDFAKITASFKGSVLYFDDTRQASFNDTNLYGQFNAKNTNAALLASALVGVARSVALAHLKDFEPAYGRGEVIKYKNKTFQIFLAKNPASVNENLKMVLEENLMFDAVIFMLNDNVPDGHDVSWIYDIDPILLKKTCQNKAIFVSGTRVGDMAVRLQYAGVMLAEGHVISDLGQCLDVIKNNNNINNLVLFPNYSAMLESRKILVGKRI